MANELLNCPFCNATARLQPVGDEQDLFNPECTRCEAAMDIWKPKQIAIKLWNARQPKPCVWTFSQNIECYTASCGAGFRRKVGDYCSHCGGKIEESE